MSTELINGWPPSDSLDAAADEGTGSLISDLLRQLTTSFAPRTARPDGADFVAVAAVGRYLGDAGHKSGSCYLYDVTLTDGACRAKCHLAPDLNRLVQRGCLWAGRAVRVAGCGLVYDEKRLNCCFLQIEALELGPAEPSPGLSIPGPSSTPPRNLTASQRGRDLLKTLQQETPLRGGKAHYLPLWNNTDPHGREWNAPKALPAPKTPLEDIRLISLQHLATTWRTKVEFPHLLVRLMNKSRLRYYGRPGTKVDFPYQAYLEVADQTGMMPVVLWNSLCPEWYQSLHVGTVLLLHRYSVKHSYQMRTWATPHDPQTKTFRAIEICLNPRDPCADIQIVPTEQIKAEWRLPDIKYNFITRLELDKLPDAHTCDVIGLVTFVGRCERIRREDGSEDFYLYRWVHAVDGSTEQPFVLELFATSQPETFEQIHPMTYLVCTQMKVVRGFRSGGAATSVPYLTTSNESQISISGNHKGQPYTQNPKVQGFIQWIKVQCEKDVLKKSVIGGYYSFPPAPTLFQDYCKNLDAGPPLTSTSELKKVIENLHYREHKWIALQGTIVAVRYVCHTDSTERLGAEAVQRARDRPDLPLKKDNAISALSSEPVRLGEDPEKDSSSSQRTKELQAVPVRVYKRCSSPVMNHYMLRRRYPLRDLQKIYYNKWPCRKALRKKMQDPPMGVRKRQTDRRKRPATVPVCEQEADVPVSAEGFTQDAEEPVAANKDEQGRCEAKTSANGTSQYTWESTTWPEIREHLSEHLDLGELLPESIPRKFDYKHRDFLMRQSNLQAAECRPITATSKMNLQCFGSTCNHGYYSMTIVGVNHQVAVDVVFLPAMMSHKGHRMLGLSMDVHDNTLASIMASGYICDEETTDNHQKQMSSSPDQIVRTAADLDSLHVICVLDICHHAGDKSEVILNKIYKGTD
uniref:RPA-related protein RADX n=1 Tax=Pristiophorus japonicus TaxID=55135 RepID=UPI00398E97BC